MLFALANNLKAAIVGLCVVEYVFEENRRQLTYIIMEGWLTYCFALGLNKRS